MKDFFDRIIQFGIVGFMLFMSKTCSDMHNEGGNNKAISNYKKMIFDNSSTIAEYYPEYKETSIKVMGVPMKSYDFRYFFTVNHVKYEGERVLHNLPKENLFHVFYLKNDPNFNTATPKEDLKHEQEKNSSNSNLYWSIGWGVLGSLILLGLLIEIKDKIKGS